MAQEIELKLDVRPAAIAKAADLPWLRELASGPEKREKLTSVYFDTPKFELRNHGLSLRVRHIGDRRLQTIKSIAKGGRGALGRDEWEEEIAGSAPDLRRAKGTALAPLVTKRLRRKLRPVFETVVERQTLPVRSGASDVEVAVDRGYIKAGDDCEPISEIELELKGGERAEIAQIAERLGRSLPVAYGARPKQDRGYALLAGDAAGAVHAANIRLDAAASTADAFRVIALSCLDHAFGNERAVRCGNAEGVHQMRVGLRRFRAALSVFKGLVQGPDADEVKTGIKWLSDELGPARELDVLIGERVEPAREAGPVPEMGVLAKGLDGQRRTAMEKAGRAVASERYRALGLAAALWIVDGEWSRSTDALVVAQRARPATDFAAEILRKRLKKILKKAARVADLTPRRRHKLRIAVKKLRYAVEFFAALYGGAKREEKCRRFAKALRTLQSALGTLNDIEIHKRIAGAIAHPHAHGHERARRQPQKALAIGFIVGQEQAGVATCLARVAEAAERLKAVDAFWK